ncbi:MAG: CBS domain-containing protein [Burkholderiaceae bacterium]|nr:CBS domain-containing protein [Burkholderiaceae bacterium]
MAKTIKEVLAQHQRPIISVTTDATVRFALGIMATQHIGALPVIDDGKLVGIFSERDYARHGELKGRTCDNTVMRQIMTSPVISINPEVKVDECMQIMTDKRIRHLPVVREDRVIGMISIGDVVKEMIDEQKQLISQLETYIHG